MLYRPAERGLWDTTLIHDGADFHLFYLSGGDLGHAVSTDLARWEERPPVNLHGPAGSWNEGGCGLTGDIVRHAGRWHLLAGCIVDGDPSVYGLFLSDDLEQWEPYPRNPVLRPAPPYRTTPLPTHEMLTAWRDPAIYARGDGSYEILMCARAPESGARSTGALVGRVRTRDFVRWEHLAPLADVGEHVLYAEVPGWFELNGRHYLYFLDLGWGGTRVHARSQGDDLAGTFYLTAEAFEGPYQWPEAPLLLGSRQAHMGPWATRVREYDGKLLIYYHISAQRPSFGVPKEVVELAPGRLGLRYLPILEELARSTLLHAGDAPKIQTRRCDVGHWQVDSAGAIHGEARAVGSSGIVLDEMADAVVEVEITLESGAAAGVLLRASRDASEDPFAAEADRALAAVLDAERTEVALREVRCQPGHGWGYTWRQARGIDPRASVEQRAPFPVQRGQKYRLRLLARGEFVELFIDDLWVLTAVAETLTEAGHLECFVERGAAIFAGLRVLELPALA